MRLTHDFTYWPPGSNTPQEHKGYVSLKGVAPKGQTREGRSVAASRDEVFAVGGVVARGLHATVPLTAREVKAVTNGESRRGRRTLYEATLADHDGSALFETAVVWRTTPRDDGAGGVIQEPATVGAYPCNVTFTPAEDVSADNERPDGRYTVTFLRDADVQGGDTLYIQERSVYLSITGHVDRSPVGLFTVVQAGVSDEQNPDDLQP